MDRNITVRAGDTLSGIALREVGRADAWRDIFIRNFETILSAQRRARPAIERLLRGRPFRAEDWIFAGTVLVIPG